jgi:putative tryptophan/tyrosine transport system substrate-binding protein
MKIARSILIWVLFVPLVAQAQVKTWRLGILSVTERPAALATTVYKAFLDEMRSLGYREGDNLLIEWRHTRGQPERRREEAAAVMAWKPDVVFTVSGINAMALREADVKVPIVVGAAGDLVGMRLAATLSRPGGNVTGLQILSPDLAAKRLQLLKDLMPDLQRVAVLHAAAEEDSGFYDRIYAELQSAGRSAGVTLPRFTVKSSGELERIFAAMTAGKAGAVLVVSSPLMSANRQRIVALAAQRRIPAMYEVAGDAEEGGLIAYGPKVEEMFRRGALYVDRVLKGAHPSEMPIEQPTQFELVINRRAAAALGLKIPVQLLLRAERVIE